MARIRSIKPELRDSRLVASWPIEVRYFWVLLLGYLDDSGRGHDMPKRISGDCFPHDDFDAEQIDKWLSLMTHGIDDRAGPICRYEVQGMRFIHAINWREHQKPNRPTKSRLPRCPLHESLSEEISESLSEGLMQTAVMGAGEQGSRGAGEQGSRGLSESLTELNMPNARQAAQIILDATACNPSLAAETVATIHRERHPRNLPALVHTLINAGEIGAWLQKAQNRIDRQRPPPEPEQRLPDPRGHIRAVVANSSRRTVAKPARTDIVDEQKPEQEEPP